MSDFFDELYRPVDNPDRGNLNDVITEEAKTQERDRARKKIHQRAQEAGPDAPLSRQEAEEAERIARGLRKRTEKMRERINVLMGRIDEEVAPEGEGEYSLALDISGKPSLKKAIKKVFGVKTDTMTYSMYKEALDLKRQLEKEEGDAYIEEGGIPTKGLAGSGA